MRAYIIAIAAALSLSSSSSRRDVDVAPHDALDTLAWRRGPALAAGRDHHVTFATRARERDRLWVAGGNDYRHVLADVWWAEIAADGQVGDWHASHPLPAPRAGHTVGVWDRLVIVAGGQDSTLRRTRDVWVATLDQAGALEGWRAAAALPAPRFHHAMVVANGWLYVTGGLEQRESVPSVFRARILGDTIGGWEALPDLPRPRSHHAMVAHGGALYVVGGLDGNPAGANTPLDDVLRAELRPDGTIGEWRDVSRLPRAYATHASIAAAGALWLFGGVEDNARFVNVVLRAPLAADGSVGLWTPVAPGLPLARSHVHQIPFVAGRVYTVGGSNRRVVNGDVYWAPLVAGSTGP